MLRLQNKQETSVSIGVFLYNDEPFNLNTLLSRPARIQTTDYGGDRHRPFAVGHRRGSKILQSEGSLA